MNELDLSDSGLITLPDLSALSIKRLNAKWNKIQILWEETMPAGIEELDLEGNTILNDGLLTDWPDSIKVLNLSRNNLYSLEAVIHWPLNLRVLNLSRTLLTILNCADFPESLEELDISYTDIPSITSFPVNLKKLVAERTLIRSFPPRCPDSLETFIFVGTIAKIGKKALPNYWGKSLKHLDLNSNGLRQIPNSLPETLEYGNFSNNLIREIPRLPLGLKLVHLGNNRILEIPPWFSDRGEMKFTIHNNSLVEIPTHRNCLLAYPQFVGERYFSAAKKIQRTWRRNKIPPPLRTWMRTKIIKYDLLALAMSPERAGKFEDISPEWKYKYQGP